MEPQDLQSFLDRLLQPVVAKLTTSTDPVAADAELTRLKVECSNLGVSVPCLDTAKIP